MLRQHQLDAINLKIARTSQSDEGTGCFLPVMIGDVFSYVIAYKIKKHHICDNPEISSIFYHWHRIREPLDKQSDDCISYIYNLL